jgi:2-polyprenyl-3-methyl-5-hydroxy-6-metoxy-1,4-benzoquinol methylase
MGVDSDQQDMSGLQSPSGDAGGQRGQKPARYDFDIDLSEDTTHTAVIRMVGRERRVLELGPATGYMSKALNEQGCSVVAIELDEDMARLAEEYCERVIVGDLDTLDLEQELGSDRFDVIVAADVLEHLKDPLAALRRLRQFLEPEAGYFVVSLPNIAHGSVRLALLEGHFSYQDLGLLDRTHLRFFTRESIERLFDEAELAIVEISRRELDIGASEVPFDRSGVPDAVMRAIEQDPDARTYQFVLKALPLEQPGLRPLQRRLREQALALETASRQAAEAQELRQAFAAISAREGQLRSSLVEAHDQLLRRDDELRSVKEDLERLESERAEREAERDRLVRENHELWDAQNEARVIIAARDEEIQTLRVRLNRIANSLPFRIWYRIGRLPVIRRAFARRTASYEAELGRRGRSSG